MWSNVGLTTAIWSNVEQCGMGGMMRTISNKISYDRIWPKNWEQHWCPMLRTTHQRFVFIVERFIPLRPCCRRCSRCRCRRCIWAVKFVRYHFGLAGCFTTYLLYLTSCNVVRCCAMSMSHCQSHAMWRDVAQCHPMSPIWDWDEFLLGFCYECSSKKVSQKFHQNFCWIVAGLYFYVFCYKSLSGTETMARRDSSTQPRLIRLSVSLSVSK